jgi:hypothetical protein
MWIAYMVLAVIVGAVLGIAGAGFLAVPIVLVLLGLAAYVFMRQSANTAAGGEQPAADPDEIPQDTDHAGAHVRTGPAHEGQEHMVPGQRS